MCPGSPGPDPLDNFFVRFHYYGSFQQVDGKLDYVGELVAEMIMPRDDLSYEELYNSAEDIHQMERGHYRGSYTYKLHWLPLGKKVSDGLMFMCDDESVKTMDIGTIDSYADVFVEELDMPIQQHFDNDKEMQPDQTMLSANDEQFDICAGDEQIDICAGLLPVNVGETYSRRRGTKLPLISVQVVDTGVVDEMLLEKMASPAESAQVSASSAHETPREVCASAVKLEAHFTAAEVAIPAKLQIRRRAVAKSTEHVPATKAPHVAPTVGADHEISTEHVPAIEAPPVDKSDEEDTDYEPIPDCSSGEDSEAEELRKLAREIRRNERAKKLGQRSGIIMQNNKVQCKSDEDLDAGFETPYFDSDEDDFSYDEESDGEGGTTMVRRKSKWPRFDSKAEKPNFQLGMVFRSREHMKKAVISYGIKTHRHLLFRKDEHDKVRAYCS
ncbi:uncharacterized protein [Triticum aestivum]|uniref:uncharacterized protein n=1 Tax=Triticum aestivum TaxID=4565 RepID=UPI001D0320CB|nr:uncharacterized protein LOC123056795 [Triticum aestivum]